MKVFKTFIVFLLVLWGSIDSVDAVVVKVEAVCETYYPPNAPGNMYWADQAMTMHKQAPENPDLLKQAVRFSEVAVLGYQYTCPVTFYLELSDSGDIIKYRIESLYPYVVLQSGVYSTESSYHV